MLPMFESGVGALVNHHDAAMALRKAGRVTRMLHQFSRKAGTAKVPLRGIK